MTTNRITVTVKPNSKKIGVEKRSDTHYLVRVNKPPVDGKANEAVIDLLADFFQIAKSKITIVRGEKSKIKVIELTFS